jgi:hypothetical protein
MNGFLNFLIHFVFIATFGFLYIVSIILLKPFRMHKRRPASTIALKLSYLIYLLVFLILAYIVLFYSGKPGNLDDFSYDSRYNLHYIAVILSFLVPNLAIMFRSKVKVFRSVYNIVFTGVNAITIMVLLVIMYSAS